MMQLGLENLCKPTQGDFLNMPFANESFDGAYAIEATCHAAKVRPILHFLHLPCSAHDLTIICSIQDH